MSEKLSQRFAKAVVKMREVQNNRYHTDHAVDVAILCDAAFDKILSALRLAESPSVAEGVEREREDALFLARFIEETTEHHHNDKGSCEPCNTLARVRNRKE